MPDAKEFVSVGTAQLEDDSVTAPKIADNVHLAKTTQPLNSKGNSFPTIQAAIDDLAGSGWVYVPSGTFNEAIILSDDDVVLFGAGWGSIIDGGTIGNAVNAIGDRCTIRDLQLKTTTGEGNNFRGILIDGVTDISVINVFINGSDSDGITITGAGERCRIIGCFIFNSDLIGINIGSPETICIGNTIDTTGTIGIQIADGGDDSILSGNMITTTSDDGVFISANGDNCVVVANRITAWTNEAIDDNSGTSTVGNNDTT